MLLSKKGQGNLETLILIGGGVLVAVVIVTILVSLGGQSRDSASEQVDNVSSSTDGPLPPTITSVKANYLDCETIDVGGSLRKIGLLSFSWKPLSREGTYKLIIENKDNYVLNEGDYTVILDGNIIPEDNLNPLVTNNLIVSDIDLGNGSCGDSYYLSIEVSKNNQSKKSSKYSFNWSDSGPKTTVVSRPLFNPVPGSYNYFSFPSTITLDVTDPSVSVYYTVDGSDPYTSGIPYTLELPISISPGTTIKAYSEYNGLKSGIASGTYTVSYDTVSSVTATPDSSINLEDPINVVLSSATPSSTIYYTLDSSTPDCSGSFSEYTSPIIVSTDSTIKAIACRENYNDSSVSTFTYNFFIPLDPVIFTPPAGDYSAIQNITLSNSNPGATIHYTTSGFDPTLLSPVYSSPISVSSPVTIKAMAAVGSNTGPISQADYNVTLPANIATFSIPSGTYNNIIYVDLLTTTYPPYSIYYTTDGSTPTSSSTQYIGTSIEVTRNQTLKAIVYKPGYLPSSVSQADYAFKLDAPTFSPLPGAYSDSQSITITSVAGAQIRYTINGATPTPTTGTQINSGESTVPITSTSTLRAITYKTGWTSSDVSTGVYTINAPAATPTFSPNGGTHTNSVNVTLSCSTPSSTIRYTTDGTDPSRTDGLVYSSPINFTSTTTLKAVCYASGYSTSPVATQTFTVQLIASPATFSIPSGTYNEDFFVDLLTTTYPPYKIYYTTDGSTPTSSSTQYIGTSIDVTRNQTLKAIVYKSGYLPSSVSQADYAFKLDAPTFSPLPGTYSTAQNVVISSVEGAQISYTLDNSTPVQGGVNVINHGESVLINSPKNLKAIAYKTGWSLSDLAQGYYNVDITPDPVTVLGGGATCNANATLTATGGANGTIYYQGTTSNGTSTMNASTSEVVSNPGTYYFRSRSTSGTWGTQGSATVSFNTPSVAPTSITGNTSVCSGSPVTLTATGGTVGTGATYQWYVGSCGSAISLGSSSSITISPTSTATYYARLSGTCNTTSCVSKTVTIASPPTVNVTPGERCGTGSVTLGATTTSGTIEWYTSSTGGSPIATGNSFTTPSLSSSRTYYVGVNGGTCNLTTRVPVTATILQNPGSVSLNISESGPGYTTISATGGSGGTIYFQGTTSMGTSTSLGGSPQTVNSNGTYYFRARSTNGCWGSQSGISVTIPTGLSNLVLSNNPGNFNFDPSVYTYDSVRYLITTTNSFTVTPTGSGNITVNGTTVSSGSPSSAISISDGLEKTVTINVTEGANSSTYTLKVRKIITSATGAYNFSQGTSGGYAYQVYKFTSGTGSFTSNISVPSSQLLVVGGGGGGGSYNGRGGAGGQLYYSTNYTIPSGSTSISIGAGGTAASAHGIGGTGGTSSFGAISRSGGVGGASGWGLSGAAGRNCSNSSTSGTSWLPEGYAIPGAGCTNSISGSSLEYSRGGYTGWRSGYSVAGPANTGIGGAGNNTYYGLAGGSGVVIVRVQIPV